MVIACPVAAAPPAPTSRQLAQEIQTYLRDSMPVWRERYPGRGGDGGGGDGLRGERAWESKRANIGISLPGTGERPAAPVFVDGEKFTTLKGEASPTSSSGSSTSTCGRDTARSRFSAEAATMARLASCPYP